jgi:hypothetical protein
MCNELGGVTNTKNQHSKLIMKDTTAEGLTAGAWGLHLSSFIMESMPYLQATSLILAIVVSLFTLRKLLKESSEKKNK